MNELKKRQRQIKDKKILNRDEVYHGALEDILLGMLVLEFLASYFEVDIALDSILLERYHMKIYNKDKITLMPLKQPYCLKIKQTLKHAETQRL